MRNFNNIAKKIEKISDILGFMAFVLIIALTVLISIEVVCRSVFNVSTLIADEYSTYFMAGISFLGLSFVLKRDGHIKVKILSSKLSKKNRKILDSLCCIVAIIFLIYFSIYSFRFFIESYICNMTAQTPSETPLFIPRSLIFIGILSLIFQFIARIIHNINEITNGF